MWSGLLEGRFSWPGGESVGTLELGCSGRRRMPGPSLVVPRYQKAYHDDLLYCEEKVWGGRVKCLIEEVVVLGKLLE
jgi:hypothetical protein